MYDPILHKINKLSWIPDSSPHSLDKCPVTYFGIGAESTSHHIHNTRSKCQHSHYVAACCMFYMVMWFSQAIIWKIKKNDEVCESSPLNLHTEHCWWRTCARPPILYFLVIKLSSAYFKIYMYVPDSDITCIYFYVVELELSTLHKAKTEELSKWKLNKITLNSK